MSDADLRIKASFYNQFQGKVPLTTKVRATTAGHHKPQTVSNKTGPLNRNSDMGQNFINHVPDQYFKENTDRASN
jgi:hypothetical protein